VEVALAAVDTIDWGPIDLPGPTGEANRLRLVGRGRALCLGPSPAAVAAQAIQALAAGCAVVAVLPRQTPDEARAQTQQNRAAGVDSAVPTPDARADTGAAAEAIARLRQHGAPIAALVGRLDPAALSDLAVDVVALVAMGTAGGDTYLRACRRTLAAREGPIVPLSSDLIRPAAFVHERAVCIDTTAAGGNASLLVGAGD
jgi:RHH-type proline utilization regulon transcriptional repressor/proline dehydrogenase/delta 1-pyrroline-5-carboxylate dehydrogenase